VPEDELPAVLLLEQLAESLPGRAGRVLVPAVVQVGFEVGPLLLGGPLVGGFRALALALPGDGGDSRQDEVRAALETLDPDDETLFVHHFLRINEQ
jgi:hypothetical protein